MSDFILPGDMEAFSQSVADDILHGRQMLARMCTLKQYPLDIAEAKVFQYICNGLNELEALRKVYHQVAKV